MLITKGRFLKSTAPLLLWFFGLVSAFGQRMESAATIAPGEGIGRIIGSFPNLHVDEELTYGLSGGRSEKDIEMFVDRSRGIGFEFRAGASADPTATGYCRAIHVFRPGTDPRVMESFDRQ